jgi:hypothetical protein
MLPAVLFAAGIVGGVWTVVYALLSYRAERLSEFDRILEEVVYEEVYRQYCAPIVLAKLRLWTPELSEPLPETGVPPTRNAFLGLRRMVQISDTEYETFTALCRQSIAVRRLGVTRGYIMKRVEDVASQYIWRDRLVSELIEFLVGNPLASEGGE